jgi:hypothetical protein
MDYTGTWFGFLAAEIVKQCIELCDQECPACKDGIIAPLLHYHNELNLREKMGKYISKTVVDLSKLFDQFVIRFGLFTLDQDQFVNIGQSFINFSTPEAIFYGKYINYDNDQGLYGRIESQEFPQNPIKGKRKKKNVIQDDLLRTSIGNC